MGHRCFDVSIEDQVAHVILNRPEKRNSMIPEFWDELPRSGVGKVLKRKVRERFWEGHERKI